MKTFLHPIYFCFSTSVKLCPLVILLSIILTKILESIFVVVQHEDNSSNEARLQYMIKQFKHSTLMVQEETTAYVQRNSMESTQNNIDTIKNIQRGTVQLTIFKPLHNSNSTQLPTTNLAGGHFNDDSLVVLKKNFLNINLQPHRIAPCIRTKNSKANKCVLIL